jgi:hypothetical protein
MGARLCDECAKRLTPSVIKQLLFFKNGSEGEIQTPILQLIEPADD